METEGFQAANEMPRRIAASPQLSDWPLIVMVDDVKAACADTSAFLWTTFNRFEPAADIHAREASLQRHHIAYTAPVVIDARMKPWYPPVVECDPETAALVDTRWGEYFPSSRGSI